MHQPACTLNGLWEVKADGNYHIIFHFEEGDSYDNVYYHCHRRNNMKRGMWPPHPISMIKDVLEGIKEEKSQALTIWQVFKGVDTTPKTLSNILNDQQAIVPKWLSGCLKHLLRA